MKEWFSPKRLAVYALAGLLTAMVRVAFFGNAGDAPAQEPVPVTRPADTGAADRILGAGATAAARQRASATPTPAPRPSNPGSRPQYPPPPPRPRCQLFPLPDGSMQVVCR